MSSVFWQTLSVIFSGNALPKEKKMKLFLFMAVMHIFVHRVLKFLYIFIQICTYSSDCMVALQCTLIKSSTKTTVLFKKEQLHNMKFIQ